MDFNLYIITFLIPVWFQANTFIVCFVSLLLKYHSVCFEYHLLVIVKEPAKSFRYIKFAWVNTILEKLYF